jgi:hypothetical protein
MMTIVHSMRFLLISDMKNTLCKSSQPVDRVVVDLAVDQNEKSGYKGEDRQDDANAT